MIKFKILDKNHRLAVDSTTNMPIATIKAKPKLYSRGSSYDLTWHPTMRAMYPTQVNSMKYSNIESTDSLESASNKIEGRYRDIVEGPEHPDPVKWKQVSSQVMKTTKDKYEQNPTEKPYAEYHLHDPLTDKPVASMFIHTNQLKNVGINSTVFDDHKHLAFLEYHGEQPSEVHQKIMDNKWGDNPTDLMRKVKWWSENKHKEPTFIGTHKTDSALYFKHKLSPDEAAEKYTQAIQKTNTYSGHQVIASAPGMRVLAKAPTNRHDAGTHVIVDATEPNVLKHLVVKTHTSDGYGVKTNSATID